MAVWIVTAVLILAVLAGIFLFRCVGKMFLKNISRKNPGEKFSADIDVSFYKNSPVNKLAADGMAYMKTLTREEVSISSEDGLRLHAVLFPAGSSPGKFVIGIHGFQSHALNEFGPHIEFYRSCGFSMLLPDDRAHGYSEGRYITMGVRDRRDCISWAKYLAERFGPDIKILLHGVSMGGATVLSAVGEDDLPPQVIGIVSDCGYTCVKDALAVQIRNLMHVPPAVPVKICQWYAKHRAGFDFNEARPIDQVRKAGAPVFIVQGADDVLVPRHMAEELYEACSSENKLLIVEHANHAESIAADPDGYHGAMHELFGISPDAASP